MKTTQAIQKPSTAVATVGLQIGAANDASEREADQVADAVIRGDGIRVPGFSFGGVSVQRKCASCEDERVVRREASSAGGPTVAPPVVGEVLRSPGRPLEAGVRSFMESRFGHEFGDVRVHDDARAAESARAVSAHAYTVGRDVVFARGRYAPQSMEGRRLIAHELAHVAQQPGHLARDPDPTSPPERCQTSMPVGAARAYPGDRSRWTSGAYSIWGPRYAGEDTQAYSDVAVQAWIRWRFGTLSEAVSGRIRSEAVGWAWQWNDTPPARGCQAVVAMSIASMNSLVALASRDAPGRQAESRETHAGMPALPPPAPIPDEEIVVTASASGGGSTSTTRTVNPDEEAERLLDPTSVYEGGATGTATHPPFPARMEGQEMEVPRGIGTYTMVLDYAAVARDPLLEIAYRLNAVSYHWELFNVTRLVRSGLGHQAEAQGRTMPQNPQAAAAAGGATRQRAQNAADQLSEETVRSWRELRSPRRAAAGGSATDVVTRTWANELNLTLLPVSAIVAAGGWSVGAFVDLLGAYSKEHEVAFPDAEGFYMVRCVAQPAPRGPNQSEVRAASVRSKIVEVRAPETLARNALDMPEAQVAELNLRKRLTRDEAEQRRLDEQIAAIQEQSSGDIVAYLTRLVRERERERDAAPSWERGRFERELESIRLRLEQARRHREGTTGTHHRPRAAFTSVITGETYALMFELTEVPSDRGARFRLIDLTVPDREPIERSGATPEEAVRNVFREFSLHGDLGRGRLVVRMPSTWTEEPRELSLETGSAGTALVRQRLQDLAMALLVLSFAVPGVGEVSAVLAAGLAADRLIRRGLNGTLRPDAESVSDTLALLGAVAQGAHLVGQLRVVQRGDAFVGALRTGDQAAIQAAAQTLNSAIRMGRGLGTISTVVNVGGLIWGNAVVLYQLAQIQQEELDGHITHAEARRRRAETLTAAFRDNLLFLGGMLRARPTGRTSEGQQGEGPPSPSDAARRANDTISEAELDRRARQANSPRTGAPSTEPRPDGVRVRFRTPDGLHEIFVLNDGGIFRCSVSCAQLRTWYGNYLGSQPEGVRRQEATQLDGELRVLEARSAAGENTPEFQQAIGALDVRLREFIAPELRAELQGGSESRALVRPGEQLLTTEQVRNLLRVLSLDEIHALLGPEGLRSAEGIRRLADSDPQFLRSLTETASRFGWSINEIGRLFEAIADSGTTQAQLLDVLTHYTSTSDVQGLRPLLSEVAAGGERGRQVADFLGRVSRIRSVVTFDLPALIDAFMRGDAILDHGPLQTGVFLEDVLGGQYGLEGGRLDIGTGGRLPAALGRPPIIDFVIIESAGTYRLVLGREHTGLSRGRAFVFAAGEFVLDRSGVVRMVRRRSGHYRPSEENLQRAVEFLYSRGTLSRTTPVVVDASF